MISRRKFSAGALTLATAAAAQEAFAAPSALIDSHTHTFLQSLPMAANARYKPDYDASYSTLLATAEKNGVGRVVIAQPSFLGFDNSYMFAALRAEPKRLRGVPWIAPDTSRAQWDEMGKLGVVGLRFPIFGLPKPDWSAYKDAFAEAKRRNWHLHLYVEGKRLAETLPVLLDSGAIVVVPHFGMFDPKLGPKNDPAFKLLCDAAKTRQLYVMLSGPYRTSPEGAREAAPMLLEAFGPERLIWASDWPHTSTTLDRVTTYPEMRQALNAWVPDAKARAKILTDTPARLFHFT